MARPLGPIVPCPYGIIGRDSECLDHVIILNEDHLRAILAEYIDYYHEARAHLSLDRNAPTPRRVKPAGSGRVVAEPFLGGLHHRYRRAA